MTTEVSSSAAKDQKPTSPGIRDTARLIGGLRDSLSYHEQVENRVLPPLLAYLGTWQSVRLSRTHADFLKNPETSKACRFFLSDVYAPLDFAQRDYDGQRIFDFMNRFLPEATLVPLALALEVNALSQQLDQELAEALTTHLGVTDHFETWQYEEAYRLCNNYDDRVRQIDLVTEVGKHLDRVGRLPLVGSTLRVAKGPAQRLGWIEMQNFLERGLDAWKSLRQPDEFLDTIEQRERAILNRIYGLPGGAPPDNPYLVTDGGPPEIEIPTA
ncbi:MAG: hypothetical protein U9R25_16740 [Chloroflexota bacterium]|nr:hypothetical protein [Chloroflexota bacterium]